MTTCSRRSPPRSNAGKQLWLKHGEPMLFDGGTKGLTLDREALNLKVVDVADGDWQAADVIVHDPKNKAVAHMLIDMPFGAFPMALGVLYDDPRPTFESAVLEQNARPPRASPPISRPWSPRARPGRSRRSRTRCDARRSRPCCWRCGAAPASGSRTPDGQRRRQPRRSSTYRGGAFLNFLHCPGRRGAGGTRDRRLVEHRGARRAGPGRARGCPRASTLRRGRIREMAAMR